MIVVSSAALIYNSFNISVMEGIKHFGILRSIGETPKQIKKLIINIDLWRIFL
ncbi:FtsX-like permease family protein [Clostridium guangxiense]|uniref:FtsX-like permease family protein n=1 Tax=Clostridium guangxiense TaxID=1662055 RepID=UPI0038B3926C